MQHYSLFLPTEPDLLRVSVRAYDFIHRLDGAVRVADEGSLAVHVADFNKPRLGRPSIWRAGVFVEHSGSVVDFGTTTFVLIGH